MRHCILLTLFATVALSQEFEVASIKPNKVGSGSHIHRDQGRLSATHLSLKDMIVEAYGVRDYQVEGPDWIASEYFDIAAKFPEALSKDPVKYDAALQAMMQEMLADRFKLAIHRDLKNLSVYGLTVAKSGIKMKEVPDGGTHNSNSRNNHYEATCVSMSTFVGFLTHRLDLPVVDMTGLHGSYDITLDWVPEPRGDAAPGADAPLGPALPVALQEKLGLRLENRKAPVEIVVVDHAEKTPTDN